MSSGGRVWVDMARLERLIAESPQRAEQIVKDGANACAGYMADNAPVDTGELKGSIRADPHGKLTWWAHDGVDYGIYTEWGTSRGVRAKHWAWRASERTRPQYVKKWASLFRSFV